MWCTVPAGPKAPLDTASASAACTHALAALVHCKLQRCTSARASVESSTVGRRLWRHVAVGGHALGVPTHRVSTLFLPSRRSLRAPAVDGPAIRVVTYSAGFPGGPAEPTPSRPSLKACWGCRTANANGWRSHPASELATHHEGVADAAPARTLPDAQPKHKHDRATALSADCSTQGDMPRDHAAPERNPRLVYAGCMTGGCVLFGPATHSLSPTTWDVALMCGS